MSLAMDKSNTVRIFCMDFKKRAFSVAALLTDEKSMLVSWKKYNQKTLWKYLYFRGASYITVES
jgi:hypothetical protein